ncbi:hypothetical protein I7I50_12175 [Histoplasma capsulatum G186AR]|uniref:Uncharacterized protein n=1 Tax=Ajellomyces capsulatus TaxID=5037 RepID=A0A8H7YAX9_AJECA|nr:hypothetical protein I7I52_11513 [Histoplasma capsulatum]QSS70520.1 hypothetical protein I7I50_12175 [Histoplasma capsulatum G186AR]
MINRFPIPPRFSGAGNKPGNKPGNKQGNRQTPPSNSSLPFSNPQSVSSRPLSIIPIPSIHPFISSQSQPRQDTPQQPLRRHHPFHHQQPTQPPSQ